MDGWLAGWTDSWIEGWMDGTCSTGILGEGPQHLWVFAFPLHCGNGGKSRKSHGGVDVWGEHGGGGVVVFLDPSFPAFPKAFTTHRPERDLEPQQREKVVTEEKG